ncbi:ketosteroid isomerase-like protein [Ensifer sp. WSM1721]|uniref:nuclear transport factor 2 family protein n=1 Tax=Ensifer sp. WSM1721 TaxID=1041159 RepID=UPI00047E6589|nr:nuclear transport factor 2 family protein [Ensifer sp. WSM1721]
MNLKTILCAAVVLGAAATSAFASDQGSTAKAVIEQRLNELETYWNGEDAAGLVADLYAEDIVIAGEELPKPAIGREAVKDLVIHLIDAFPKAEVTVERMASESDEQIGTWVLWTLPGADASASATTVRSLFLWTKEGEKWVIKADMYSFGGY